MSKRTLQSPGQSTSILSRVFENGRGTMSQTLARQILKLGFGQADQDRMADLIERNQDGELSLNEKSELLEYVDAGHILSILHSLANLAMKRLAKVKA
jgi:hypothetical protein